MLNKEVPNFVNLGTKFGTFRRNMNLCGIRKMLLVIFFLFLDNQMFIYLKTFLFTYFNLFFSLC